MTEGAYVEVEGLRIHYLEQGEGEPVLMLHGWPTSSYLWRDVLPVVAEGNRAIAIDLPGYGRSDKPTDASYSFRFNDEILSGFLDALGVERVGLAVHDIGGPIGLHWAARHPERLSRLALLNTLVYPKLSMAAIAFVASLRVPGIRSALTSPRGLRFAMRYGVHDKSRLSEEAIRAYLEPFATRDARGALQRAGRGLHPDGLRDVEAWLPTITAPVRIIYGAKDRILPDVAKTMAKVERDVPGEVETTVLEDCGHFLQEERAQEIGALLKAFFSR